jgi:hypothetical protein
MRDAKLRHIADLVWIEVLSPPQGRDQFQWNGARGYARGCRNDLQQRALSTTRRTEHRGEMPWWQAQRDFGQKRLFRIGLGRWKGRDL